MPKNHGQYQAVKQCTLQRFGTVYNLAYFPTKTNDGNALMLRNTNPNPADVQGNFQVMMLKLKAGRKFAEGITLDEAYNACYSLLDTNMTDMVFIMTDFRDFNSVAAVITPEYEGWTAHLNYGQGAIGSNVNGRIQQNQRQLNGNYRNEDNMGYAQQNEW